MRVASKMARRLRPPSQVLVTNALNDHFTESRLGKAPEAASISGAGACDEARRDDEKYKSTVGGARGRRHGRRSANEGTVCVPLTGAVGFEGTVTPRAGWQDALFQ